MKKYFALLLALVMSLSLFACGKKEDGGTASFEHTDTTTVAVGAVVLARDDVSADDVYKFVADMFDNASSLTSSHAKYGELNVEFGASITSVPYHPGAAKYFAEKGFEVASVKDGAGNTDSRNLRFVTGGESGTYYAFGSVIAQHATNNAGINVVGLVGNGSQANVQELVDGTADFAFCQSDVMAYAYNGTNLFESKVEGFSTVAALYMEQVQIVTTDPEIKSVADLKGKNVSIVEMKDDLVSQKGVCLANSSYLREWFAWKKVPVYLETTLREVRDGAIVCAGKDGTAIEIPCDTVISSAGYISTPLVEEKGHKNVHLVGDCLCVGNLRSVVWRAYETAMKI